MTEANLSWLRFTVLQFPVVQVRDICPAPFDESIVVPRFSSFFFFLCFCSIGLEIKCEIRKAFVLAMEVILSCVTVKVTRTINFRIRY